MQYSGHSTNHSQALISIAKVVKTGRANLVLSPDAEKPAWCFSSQLEFPIAVDAFFEAQPMFHNLSTPAKLDLLNDEFLPEIFHPDLLPPNGTQQLVCAICGG